MHKKIIILMLALLLALPVSFGASASITATYDTYVDDGSPTTNYDGATELYTRHASGNERRYYVQIPLGEIASAGASTIVDDATLCVYDTAGASPTTQPIKVGLVLNDVVTPNFATMTWNDNVGGSDANSPSGVNLNVTSQNESITDNVAGYDCLWNVTAHLRRAVAQDWDNATLLSFINGTLSSGNRAAQALEAGGSDPYITISWHNFTAADPTLEKHTVQLDDAYDGTDIQNISLTVSNSSNSFTFATQNGTIIITNATIQSFGSTYTFAFSTNDSNRGYFNTSISNVVLADTGTTIGTTYQAIAYVNASEIITGTAINNFAVTSPALNFSNSTGFAKLFLKAGTYTFLGNATGYLDTSKSFTISKLSQDVHTLDFGSIRLNVTAISALNGNTLTGYNISINGITRNHTTHGTASNHITFPLINGTYNVTFSNTNFSTQSVSLALNSSVNLFNYTFSIFTLNSVNISIFDEILGKDVNHFNDKIVTLEFTSDSFSQNYTATNGTFFVDLLSPGAYRITYGSTGYKNRDYYFTLENRTHNNMDLYLLSLTNSTDVTITVKDGSGGVLEDATINLKRYYVESNSYVTVAMSKTDFEGQSVLDVDFDDAFYQIFASSNGFSENTQGSRIFSTTLEVVIVTQGDPYSQIDVEEGITSSLTFNNDTNTFSYTFSDQDGIQRRGTLEVSELAASGETIVCSETVTSSSGTILCILSDINGTYSAVGKINSLEDDQDFITDVMQIGNTLAVRFKEKIGNSGLFLSIMAAGTTAFLGLLHPAVFVVLFLAGMSGMIVAGFSVINITIYFIILILGLLVIWRIRA